MKRLLLNFYTKNCANANKEYIKGEAHLILAKKMDRKTLSNFLLKIKRI